MIISVINGAGIAAYLEKKKRQTSSQVTKGIKEATEFVTTEVKASVDGKRPEPRSVLTGELRDSVKGQSVQYTGVISTDVEHGEYIEFGTSRIPARRHFNNSKDRNKRKIAKIIDGKIK